MLIFVSFAVFILKRLKERMLHAFVGIQDIKIFLPLVMVIMSLNVKDVEVLSVFIPLRISSIQNINFQQKKVACAQIFILRVLLCQLLVFMMVKYWSMISETNIKNQFTVPMLELLNTLIPFGKLHGILTCLKISTSIPLVLMEE